MGRIAKMKRQMIMEANMRLLNEQEETQLWKQVVSGVGENEWTQISDGFATIGDRKNTHITVGNSGNNTIGLTIENKENKDFINKLNDLDKSKRTNTHMEEYGSVQFEGLTDVNKVVETIKNIKSDLGL